MLWYWDVYVEGNNMGMKKISVANFNVVFLEGEKEKPLLSHFDDIVMPSLTSGKKRRSGDCTYLLLDVKVKKTDSGDLVLCGIIVKKTTLEVKSDLDERGELVEKDDKYSTAPYSTFVIYLKNHRMLFAENQKGSPSLSNFKALVNYLFGKYVAELLKEIPEEKKDKFPIPIVQVVGIPMREKMATALKQIDRINTLTLRFYPLNGDGDIDFTNILGGMATDVRKMVGSKCGEVIYRSPKNISGIINVLDQSAGTVEPIFNVTYPNKTKGVIKNDMISEQTKVDIPGETGDEEINQLINHGEDVESIGFVSSENNKVYERNQAKIIPFINK